MYKSKNPKINVKLWNLYFYNANYDFYYVKDFNSKYNYIEHIPCDNVEINIINW